MLRTIWGDNERYIKTYWEKYQNRYYVAGDSANRDADGYYWIMGRIDDVLNVAGHRLGTAEIESALVAHPRVAEAAVVSKPHEVKGESVFAYVTLNIDRPAGPAARALIEELRLWVAAQLSPIAKPDEIRLTDNLPKTRSGKIMRRLLRAIARGEDITQDVTTLENPAILEQLRGEPQEPSRAAPAAVRRHEAVVKKAPPTRPRRVAPAAKKRSLTSRVKAKRRAKAARRPKATRGAKATRGPKAAGRVKVSRRQTVKRKLSRGKVSKRAARGKK